MRENLKNIVDDFEILDWNHLDFIWGTNAKIALYNRIINLIEFMMVVGVEINLVTNLILKKNQMIFCLN